MRGRLRDWLLRRRRSHVRVLVTGSSKGQVRVRVDERRACVRRQLGALAVVMLGSYRKKARGHRATRHGVVRRHLTQGTGCVRILQKPNTMRQVARGLTASSLAQVT